MALGVVHHTVDANEYGPQDSAAMVLAICRYHRNTSGWRDIGYNFLVDRYGQVFEGRAGGTDQPVIGAQAQGYNGVSTGVANIGTFTDAAQTPEAIAATAQLLAWKLSLHGAPVSGQVTVTSAGGPSNRYPAGTPVTFERIAGHRDADTTACPGDALVAQLPEIRRQAAVLAPSVPAPPAVAVSIAVADAHLDLPQLAHLTGRAADSAGAPLAHAPVSIQIASGSRFLTRARTTTASDGTWVVSLPTQYSRSDPGGRRAPRRHARRLCPPSASRSPRGSACARRGASRRGGASPSRAPSRPAAPRRSCGSRARAATGGCTSSRGSRCASATGASATGCACAARRFTACASRRRRAPRNAAGRSRDAVLRAVRPRR